MLFQHTNNFVEAPPRQGLLLLWVAMHAQSIYAHKTMVCIGLVVRVMYHSHPSVAMQAGITFVLHASLRLRLRSSFAAAFKLSSTPDCTVTSGTTDGGKDCCNTCIAVSVPLLTSFTKYWY